MPLEIFEMRVKPNASSLLYALSSYINRYQLTDDGVEFVGLFFGKFLS